ncbi:hypothetical protein ILUMI_27313 [Ignelater luminosus]|uniref:PiggyBac transposable element-derived protein domain-containing protein n=1 Tax=Ignelater luminosus TaxID=2038154 RepID=A0A8K0FYA2_IGNLU|nr:hypothetical protein ILUMI_27313 [Ignelater luminosus]
MPSEKETKKTGHGSIIEKTTCVDGIDISVVSWFDNKIVMTISTYVGSQPIGEKGKRCTNKEIDLPPKDFKLAIADALHITGKSMKRCVGRPSHDVQALHNNKKRRGPTKEIPQQDVRKDGVDYLPEWHDN